MSAIFVVLNGVGEDPWYATLEKAKAAHGNLALAWTQMTREVIGDCVVAEPGEYYVQIPEFCEYHMGDEPKRCHGRCDPSYCEYAVR